VSDEARSATDDPRERVPLLSPEGEKIIRSLREDPDAPRFNHAAGDRLRAEDLDFVNAYRERLFGSRGPRPAGPPLPSILAPLAALRGRVPFLRDRIPAGLDLEAGWERVPTTSRHDLAMSPESFVPDGEPLERLIVYRTAGTTGHPIAVPHHPRAVGCYEPLIEYALSRHGVRADFGPGEVSAFLVGAQIRTYTYATALSAWRGAGFAKLNIRDTEWPRPGSQRRYFQRFSPRLLTGDPISFAEMMRLELPAKPAALVSTSVEMSPTLKAKLRERYRAPVIDWYSLVETGPIGYFCPRGNAYHQLPHDLHLEVLRADGTVAPPGERGEITVSGGRNPFAPLIRYRTGDYGRVDRAPCPCGDSMPRILELEGRVPLLFRAADGTPVSNVDVSRLLREFPLLLHEFVQRADRACSVVMRPMPGATPSLEEIRAALARLFGEVALELRFDPTLGDRTAGKALPYQSELMLED
jgi:phenylacetate-CoA ligase